MKEKPSGERKKSGEIPERLEPMGRYELVRQLGRGGMAEVFLARQTGMAGFSKQLVIKRVLPELVDDSKFVEMFLDEARLAARLTHPNICQVFELGEVNGQYFIAMEHVPGVTLTQLIIASRDKKLPVPLAASFRIVAQLCEALAYAHQLAGDDGRPLNLVHRDVTPSNVMVTPDGSVKLLDFGIARAADRTHQTQVGVAKGKLGFMSPEQLRSPQDIDHKSDLFAVGAVLYTLVVGRTPYADVIKTSNGLRDMAHGRFPAPRVVAPQVPEVVEQLILKAMAAEPNLRFISALDFSRELEKVAMSLSLSLGPHALLDFMSELDRDVSERTTRKLPRSVSKPGSDAAVVSLDTGDVVRSGEVSPKPSAALPVLVLSVAAVAIVVGTLLVVKLAQSPAALPEPEPEPEPSAPVAMVKPSPEPEPAPVPDPEPAPVEPVVVVATPDPPSRPVVVDPVPVKTPRVVRQPVTGPSGTLIVESAPKARVLMNKEFLGTTPLKVKVAVGSHRLRLDYGSTSHQLIINVVEGRETTVRDQAD